jgi:protein-L-isoaspartate(D-aspartate) O-methyltransferase
MMTGSRSARILLSEGSAEVLVTGMRNPFVRQEFPEKRQAMVSEQLAGRGIRDARVLDAMRAVPREAFVPEYLRGSAYDDSPLPIGSGQTISQPHVVAYMIEALNVKAQEKVLEVGAGSGYAAAVLGQIAAQVYAVERIRELADRASATLAALGYDNVQVRHGDGTRGWPEQAPFDAIAVAAGTGEVPEPLRQQLKEGGRLIIPVGRTAHFQQLKRITRVSRDEYEEEDLISVRFVPLIGEKD